MTGMWKAALLLPFILNPEQASLCNDAIEIHHGTVILWQASPDQVIIVADSRGYAASNGVKRQICKIIQLSGDTIFFYTGNLAEAIGTRTGKVYFSQSDVAQNAYDAVGKQPLSLQRLKDVA